MTHHAPAPVWLFALCASSAAAQSAPADDRAVRVRVVQRSRFETIENQLRPEPDGKDNLLELQTSFAHIWMSRFPKQVLGAYFRGDPSYFYTTVTTSF
jgi:hypothetical protein